MNPLRAHLEAIAKVVALTRLPDHGKNQRDFCIPDGDGFIIVAANFGQRVNPAWYYNLRAHPQVSVVAGDAEGTYYARELSGPNESAGSSVCCL